jgi:hypothetical protein
MGLPRGEVGQGAVLSVTDSWGGGRSLRVRWMLLGLGVTMFCGCKTAVTRDEVIATAYRYTQVVWMPEDRHLRHGPDEEGIEVHTPDVSLARHGHARGWWKPGVEAKGMPYQWGGFDTPESFLLAIASGKKAGDIASPAKRRSGDAGVSGGSCGIDCSGFVSRCWNLRRPYSTRELPAICERLPDWNSLLPGDILLNDRHVVIFKEWADPWRSHLVAYEAGPYPVWRVSSTGLNVRRLLDQGYAPWRYRGIR